MIDKVFHANLIFLIKHKMLGNSIAIQEIYTDKWHLLPALFVWLVLLVTAAKTSLEEAGQVAGTYKT